MLIFDHPSQIKPLALHRIVCTLGVFDGVHLGHQDIIRAVVRRAKNINGTSTVITFDRHPHSILQSGYHLPLLTTPEHKTRLIADLGVDITILMKFNRATASITAEDWIKDILWKQLQIKSIYLGRDSFFGRDREGSITLLQAWSQKLGFKVNVMKTIRIEKEPVSSTLIRNYVQQGNLTMAAKFLGRPYSVFGSVVTGSGRGKKIGFPTANLDLKDECLPPNGVYAVRIRLGEETLPAAANVGIRPTFTKQEQAVATAVAKATEKPLLEAYIIDLKQDLYDKKLEVIFVKKLREEKKFSSSLTLHEQIARDIVRAKKILHGRF